MNTTPTRVLDFGKIDPFGRTIGWPRNLLWPVQAFRVTLPSSSGMGWANLNAFENVVLEVLTVTGHLGEVELAEAVCLPVDLVRNVIFRLKDQGLVNADNTAATRSGESATSLETAEKYSSALVFREAVSGNLLPFVYELSDTATIVSGPIGLGWRMTAERGIEELGGPSPGEVLALVKKFRKRSRDHGKNARLPKLSQIRVTQGAEHYYLDCPIAFLASDAEFRIADPFGTGFSVVLEREFAERLKLDERLGQWMTNWRESLASRGSAPDDVRRGIAPYATEENARMFPELVSVLTPPRGRAHRSILDIHAAIEWALYYCCEMNNPTAAIKSVMRQATPVFGEWTTEIAQRLGFVPPRRGITKPTTGKMDNYFRALPEMDTLCVLSLVQADSLDSHPFRRVADMYPDFFGRIESLRKSRGAEGHGKSSGRFHDVEVESDKFMRDVVSTLLPTMAFEDSTAQATDSDRRALLMLRARVSLVSAIEYQTFNLLGPNAQSSLVAAELTWQERIDGDDARTYVAHLYSALQSVVRNVIDRLPTKSVEGTNFVFDARAMAVNAGLGVPPNELLTVKQWRIREAINGNDPTLGAAAMALLLVAPSNVLSDVAATDPAFLTTVATIIRARGHANRVINMAEDELKEIREACLFTMKSLLELTE